jgi:hypothetical protein
MQQKWSLQSLSWLLVSEDKISKNLVWEMEIIIRLVRMTMLSFSVKCIDKSLPGVKSLLGPNKEKGIM